MCILDKYVLTVNILNFMDTILNRSIYIPIL